MKKRGRHERSTSFACTPNNTHVPSMVKELPISTDPYEQSAEPHPDRLGQGDSKTPLMTGGSSGKLRILVLMGLA